MIYISETFDLKIYLNFADKSSTPEMSIMFKALCRNFIKAKFTLSDEDL